MSLHPTPPDERPTIGVGLLGHGFMGRAHASALRQVPATFWPGSLRPELVAIAGRDEARTREAAVRLGARAWTTDWRALVADPAVEVFDNLAPDDLHVEPTLAALAAGKHVVCEKPLAVDPDDAARLYLAAEAASVKHLTCFNYRFFPAVRLAWELLRGGELGVVHHARIRYAQDWRTDPAAPLPAATGALDIIGSHAIDQARYLLGEIESVAATIISPVTTEDRRWGEQPAERIDAVAILATLAGGASATIEASLIAPGRRNQLSWEVSCAGGSVAWNLEELNVLRVHRRAGSATPGFTDVIVTEPEHELASAWWPSSHVLGWEHGHANMWAHLLDGIATGAPLGPHAATFRDGLQASRVGAAVRAAAATGERTAVELGEPG